MTGCSALFVSIYFKLYFHYVDQIRSACMIGAVKMTGCSALVVSICFKAYFNYIMYPGSDQVLHCL